MPAHALQLFANANNLVLAPSEVKEVIIRVAGLIRINFFATVIYKVTGGAGVQIKEAYGMDIGTPNIRTPNDIVNAIFDNNTALHDRGVVAPPTEDTAPLQGVLQWNYNTIESPGLIQFELTNSDGANACTFTLYGDVN